MKVSDYEFSENEIKQLRHFRDHQKDHKLKQRFIILLAIAMHPNGIESGIEYAAAVFGKCTATINNWLL